MISSNHYKYYLLGQSQASSSTAYIVVTIIIVTVLAVLAVSSMLICIFQASSMRELSERVRALEHSAIKKADQVQEFSRRDKSMFPVYGMLVRINESINAVKSRQDSLELRVKKINSTQLLLLTKVGEIVTELRSLQSQVHHPISPYSNCDVEVHNSTCNHSIAGESILERCSTPPVPLEVEVSLFRLESQLLISHMLQ